MKRTWKSWVWLIFILKWEEMWKKRQASQHQICRQSIRHPNLSENITANVMLKCQKWQHWCQCSRTSGAVSRLPQPTEPLFRHKGNVWWKRTFLPIRWLLSLCYIINTWSYSSHLHHMSLRGPSEKVLISRFVEQRTRLQCLSRTMPKPVMSSGAIKSAKLLRKSARIWQS